MYPYDIDPRSYINSALALQTPTGAGMPQMTPASHSYYGPTHQALSDTLRSALAQQVTNAGLLTSPTLDQMGLLSPATTTPMANSFFRMDPNFAKPVYVASNAPAAPTTAAASTGISNTAQSSSGSHHPMDGGLGYNDTYTRSNGPVGDTFGATGPYSNGGGAGWSFNDGGPFSPVGGIFSGIFNSTQTPTSIDATGADRKTAGTAPAPAQESAYRLSSNDLMGGLGPQASITGTPLSAPNTYNSQTLNGMLSANYEPVTGYDSGFTRLSPTDFAASSGKLQDQLSSPETQQANSAAARQQAEQQAAQEANQLAQLQQLDAQQMADRNHGGYSGMEHSPDSGYGANNGGVSTGGESASERGGGAWRFGGPVPKHGNGPTQPVRGTVHTGEYVIRPESVKVLPPGLLSALNDIYKSPNPKKTLRGLLG